MSISIRLLKESELMQANYISREHPLLEKIPFL